MSLIELGDLSHDAPPPTPRPSFRPMLARDLRWVLAAVLAVATLLLTTASAVPEPRSLRKLWTLKTADRFMMDGDSLYLMRSAIESGGKGDQVEAYDTRTGRLRWTFVTNSTGRWLNNAIPGLLLLPLADQQLDGTHAVHGTIALDPATGRKLWEHGGDVWGVSRDGVLFADWNGDSDRITGLTWARTDGTKVWERKPAPDVNSALVLGADPDRPDRIALTSRTGKVEVRSLSDGRLLRTARLPWRESDPDGNTYTNMSATGSTLYVTEVDEKGVKVTAYSADTLERLWFMSSPYQAGVFECAAMICIGNGSQDIRAYDPPTGRQVWASRDWDYVMATHGDRMYVESHEGHGSAVVDRRTGEVLRRYGAGIIVVDPEDDVLLSLAVTKEAPPRLAVQEMRSGGPALLRGAIPALGDQGCLFHRRVLACHGTNGTELQISVYAVGELSGG